jgi:hypothetical protein
MMVADHPDCQIDQDLEVLAPRVVVEMVQRVNHKIELVLVEVNFSSHRIKVTKQISLNHLLTVRTPQNLNFSKQKEHKLLPNLNFKLL